jgi:hypothetical protein
MTSVLRGDGDDAGAAVTQVELRAPTAISTSVSTAVRLLDGQEFGRPGPPRLEQQPDEYANHSMKEKEQWYCRQDVLGTGQ